MGTLFVISAPSGAGKTSLVRALLAARANLVMSVSHTTRSPRPHEIDGRDYHFVSLARFEALVREGAFLEHASVFGNCYGTGAAEVGRELAAGHDVVLEIDWQGARQVRAAMPGCTTIFILPPSRAALRERLQARRTDSAATIEQRLEQAIGDMGHYREFDEVVVNDDFQQALAELQQIMAGEREAFVPDRPAIAPLLRQLLA